MLWKKLRNESKGESNMGKPSLKKIFEELNEGIENTELDHSFLYIDCMGGEKFAKLKEPVNVLWIDKLDELSEIGSFISESLTEGGIAIIRRSVDQGFKFELESTHNNLRKDNLFLYKYVEFTSDESASNEDREAILLIGKVTPGQDVSNIVHMRFAYVYCLNLLFNNSKLSEDSKVALFDKEFWQDRTNAILF